MINFTYNFNWITVVLICITIIHDKRKVYGGSWMVMRTSRGWLIFSVYLYNIVMCGNRSVGWLYETIMYYTLKNSTVCFSLLRTRFFHVFWHHRLLFIKTYFFQVQALTLPLMLQQQAVLRSLSVRSIDLPIWWFSQVVLRLTHLGKHKCNRVTHNEAMWFIAT